jgi:hypothetical protein
VNPHETAPDIRFAHSDPAMAGRRHRIPQQPPQPQPSPQEQAPHDPTAADLRNQVIERLRRMNAKHSFHAWERRNSDPLGPHGLAFFYADPQPEHQPTHYVLRSATRMFLDGSDVDDLPQLLYDLTGIAETYLKAGNLDPRSQMAQRADRMSPAAMYIGVGISSLDTYPVGSHSGRWRDIAKLATGPADIPGRCFAVLVDNTMLLLDRRGRREFGAFHITSTHDLNIVPGRWTQPWVWDRDLAAMRDPLTRDTWQLLARLNHLVREADRGR